MNHIMSHIKEPLNISVCHIYVLAKSLHSACMDGAKADTGFKFRNDGIDYRESSNLFIRVRARGMKHAVNSDIMKSCREL